MYEDLTPEKRMQVEMADRTLSAIESASRSYYPRVRLSEFERKLIPILQEPFNPEALAVYRSFTHLQRVPILVVADNDVNEVIYEIPSLYSGTIYSEHNGVMGSLMRAAHREAERNPYLWDQINEVLPNCVVDRSGDYVNKVIIPILRILQDYNLKMIIPTEEGDAIVGYNSFELHGNTPQDDDPDDDGLDYMD